MLTSLSWIAVDWGTSNLRVWAMNEENRVLATKQSDKGMGALDPNGFEDALLELTDEWLSAETVTPVVACGMVGAKTGWIEAQYRAVPATPISPAMTTAPCNDPRHAVSIIAGMSQFDPADVMRGEETQIAGFLMENQLFGGSICMPGTHTKWVRLEDGAVQSFRTVMTGELFSLLAKQSTLRLTVGSDGWDDAAFVDAVQMTANAPETLTGELFGLRSMALVGDMAPDVGRARLSGMLIGAELAATRDYWDDTTVRILGGAALSDLYAKAIAAVWGECDVLDGERLTLMGLAAAYSAMKESGL